MSQNAERIARALLAPTPNEPALPLAQGQAFSPPPSVLQQVLQYVSAQTSPEEKRLGLNLPLYERGADSLTFDGAVQKYRNAPVQPSARLTFSHKF